MAKFFKSELYYGTVSEYLPPMEADEYPLWKIKYDDGDGEDWDRDELLEGIRLYLRKPNASEECAAMAGNAGVVRQYVLRKDGEYDVLETSIDDLDFSQLKEYELHLLTRKLDESDGEVERSLSLEREIDYQADGPLSPQVVRLEADREAWENSQPDIRPFRSFSHIPGVRQKSKVEDVIFRDFALKNNLPIRFLQRNPKQKQRKGDIAASWIRYEKYKSGDGR